MIHRSNKLSNFIYMGMCLMMVGGRVGGSEEPLRGTITEGSSLLNMVRQTMQTIDRSIDIIIRLLQEQLNIYKDRGTLKKLNEEAQTLSLGFGITKDSVYSQSSQNYNLKEWEFLGLTAILDPEIDVNSSPILSIQHLNQKLENTQDEIGTIIKGIIMKIEAQSQATERGTAQEITSGDSIDQIKTKLLAMRGELSNKLSQMMRDNRLEDMRQLCLELDIRSIIRSNDFCSQWDDAARRGFYQFCMDPSKNYLSSIIKGSVDEVQTRMNNLKEKYRIFLNAKEAKAAEEKRKEEEVNAKAAEAWASGHS